MSQFMSKIHFITVIPHPQPSPPSTWKIIKPEGDINSDNSTQLSIINNDIHIGRACCCDSWCW